MAHFKYTLLLILIFACWFGTSLNIFAVTTTITTATIVNNNGGTTIAAGDTVIINMTNPTAEYDHDPVGKDPYGWGAPLTVNGTIIVRNGILRLRSKVDIEDGGEIICEPNGNINLDGYTNPTTFYIRDGGKLTIQGNLYTGGMDRTNSFNYMERPQTNYNTHLQLDSGGEWIIEGNGFCWFEGYNYIYDTLLMKDNAQMWFNNDVGDFSVMWGGVLMMKNKSLVGWRHESWSSLRNNGIIEIQDSALIWVGIYGMVWNGVAEMWGGDRGDPNATTDQKANTSWRVPVDKSHTGTINIRGNGQMISARNTSCTPYERNYTEPIDMEYRIGLYNAGEARNPKGRNRDGDDLTGIINLYDSAKFIYPVICNGAGLGGAHLDEAEYDPGISDAQDMGNKGYINMYDSSYLECETVFMNAYSRGTEGHINLLSGNPKFLIKNNDAYNSYKLKGMKNGANERIRNQNNNVGNSKGYINIEAGEFHLACRFENAAYTYNEGHLDVSGTGKLITHNEFQNHHSAEAQSYTNIFNGGQFIAYKIVNHSGNEFNINGGKLIFANNPDSAAFTSILSFAGLSRIIEIEDSEVNGKTFKGSLIVDKGKTLKIASYPSRGIRLPATGETSSMYTTFANRQSEVTRDSVDAALAVLAGGNLILGSSGYYEYPGNTFDNNCAIINEKGVKDNVYFHGGTAGDPDDLPGKVTYEGTNFPVMKVEPTHPYGIIEIGSNYGGTSFGMYSGNMKIPDSLYLWGATDTAFIWRKTGLYEDYGRIKSNSSATPQDFPKSLFLVGGKTNIYSENFRDIVGTVSRKNTITGVTAILNNTKYVFNNNKTFLKFINILDHNSCVYVLTEFGITGSPSGYRVGGNTYNFIYPNVLYGDDKEFYGQRRYTANYTITENPANQNFQLPGISQIGLGFRNFEIYDDNFRDAVRNNDYTVTILEGFDASEAPQRLLGVANTGGVETGSVTQTNQANEAWVESVDNLFVELHPDNTNAPGNYLDFYNGGDLLVGSYSDCIIELTNDYATTYKNYPVTSFEVLENDNIEGKNAGVTFTYSLSGTNGGATKGTAEWNEADNTITYTPTLGQYGIDSVSYNVECSEGGNAIGKLYVFIGKQAVESYTACPGASIEICATTVENVTYHFNSETNPVANCTTLVKDDADMQSVDVYPTWNGNTFPSFPIIVEKALICGGTYAEGCFETGTEKTFDIFPNDNPTNQQLPNNYGITTELTYSNNMNANCTYSLRKIYNNIHNSAGNILCSSLDDHTTPNNTDDGYAFAARINNSCNVMVYQRMFSLSTDFSDMCAGTGLAFGAWLTSVMDNSTTSNAYLTITIESLSGNQIYNKFVLGAIPNGNCDWKFYGIEFNLPETDFKLTINATTVGSNDPVVFVLDDLKTSICIPKVDVTSTGDNMICEEIGNILSGTYSDNGTFSEAGPMKAIWEYSADGTTWNVIKSISNVSGTELNFDYEIPEPTTANIGYYRMRVTSEATLWTSTCVASSDIIHIEGVVNCIEANDDNYFTLATLPVTEEVTTNDFISEHSPCTEISAATIAIITGPEHGTATLLEDNKTIKYIANIAYYGTDVFTYELICGNIKDTASVTITIDPFPDNVVETDCDVPVESMVWSVSNPIILQAGTGNVSTYQSAMVGDLDGDGGVEIVIPRFYEGNSLPPYEYITYYMHVFDRGNNTTTSFSIAPMGTSLFGAFGLARPNSESPGLIVVAARDRYLYAYNKAGVQQWKSDNIYTMFGGFPAPLTGGQPKTGGCVMFSDFNGDGWAEIVMGDRIFDLATGKLLLNLGFKAGTSQTDQNANQQTPIVSVVDINKDGKPELVWGGNVYDINITNRQNTNNNSYTLLTTNSVTNPPFANSSIKNTIPADFDKDGNVDIFAYNRTHFYIYDPTNGNVKIDFAIPTNHQASGIPFIGDIDGDGYPEVLWGQTADPNYFIVAYDIDDMVTTPTLKWTLKTTDYSAYTGLTLFDFNQDEKYEIVYRDQSRLRVLDGTNATTIQTPLFSGQCVSGTQSEYPVIADVDNDGEAEIVISGHDFHPGAGYIMIFESGLGSRWAPARKVWNQYAYNVVCINEDLTVPRKMFDIATIMAGPDELFNTADDIQPFNGFLKQQTMIDKYGNMVMYAPDLALNGDITMDFDAVTDALTINIPIINQGSSVFNDDINVTAYKDEALTTNAIGTIAQTGPLAVDGITTIQLVINNVSTLFPMNSIIIRLNDAGEAQFVVTECDLTNNESINGVPVIANDDIGNEMIADYPIGVEILDNDMYPSDCTPNVTIITQPTGGTATLVGNIINYSQTGTFLGRDSLQYELACGNVKDAAWVYIDVLPIPDNIGKYYCVIPIEPIEWSIKPAWTSSLPITTQNNTGYQNTLHAYTTPLVGDIDNDGIPDIVVGGFYGGATVNANGSTIYIYYGKDRYTTPAVPPTSFQVAGNFNILNSGVLAKININGVPTNLIILQFRDNGLLKAFDPSLIASNNQFLDPIWTATVPVEGHNGSTGTVPNAQYPAVADFDGDGNQEIYCGRRIWAAESGVCLATGTGNAGLIVGQTDYTYRSTIAADFDGDGIVELAAGTNVYSVNITNRNGTSGNTMEISSSIPTVTGCGSIDIGDGMTTVADIDCDGKLDIVVNQINSSSGTYGIMAWDPRKEIVLGKYGEDVTLGGGVGRGYFPGTPFIGNIDTEKHPEILMVIHRAIWGLRYSGTPGNDFTKVYSAATTDASGATGITLFDFNSDGIAELVYRDEDNLRIMQADETTSGLEDIYTTPVRSGTHREYPVVVDIDNTNSSAIVVMGGIGTDPNAQGGGSITNTSISIFKSNGKPWAPSRRVWNQYNYNAVNINDDLTVPTHYFNPGRFFEGADEVLGTADDIQPFNGFLMQQTLLDIYGQKAWPAPDVTFNDDVTMTYNSTNDALVLTIPVWNEGQAGMEQLCVTAYKNSIGTGNVLGTTTDIIPLLVDDIRTVTLTIPNITESLPITDIVIRLNNCGATPYLQFKECDSADNNATVPFEVMILRTDLAVTNINETVIIDELENDDLEVCESYTVLCGFKTAPTKGTALIITDNKIQYNPGTDEHGIDSLEYYVKCGTDSNAAKVYIFIFKPQSKEYYACEGTTITMSVTAETEVNYSWFDVQTDGTTIGTGENQNVLKDASEVQTVWVEATWKNNFVFPRFQMTLHLGTACGTTIVEGCFESGTIIFKEDFDGYTPWSSEPVAQLPAGITTYLFHYNLGNTGRYVLRKWSSSPHSSWWGAGGTTPIDDHTFPNDTTKGYAFFADVSDAPGQFYQTQIDNLCIGAKLSFSAWLVSLIRTGFVHPDKTNLIFNIEDINGNLLSSFSTGNIPDGDINWKLYGFEFITPTTSIVLKIINNSTGTNGADFGMDDIEVRICFPEIELTESQEICLDDSMVLNAEYVDDGTFGGSDKQIKSEWQYSEDNITWQTIAGTETTYSAGVTTISAIYDDIENISILNAGYYRIRITNSMIDFNHLCVAISDACHIKVKTCGYALAVRNGRWSDPETWFNGTVPAMEDSVIIPDGIIVYTGATAQAFGSRAYGQGADATGGVVDVDYKVGPNESQLNDNLLPDGKTIKLANVVDIQNGGALVIGHLNSIDGITNTTKMNIAGANDVANRRLEFNKIINRSKTTNSYGYSSYNIDTITVGQRQEVFDYDFDETSIKGLFVISGRTNDTIAQVTGGNGTTEFAITNDGGYAYYSIGIHGWGQGVGAIERFYGVFKAASIANKNTGFLKVSEGYLFVSGNIINGINSYNDTIKIVNNLMPGVGRSYTVLKCKDIINGQASTGSTFIMANDGEYYGYYGNFINNFINGIESTNSYFLNISRVQVNNNYINGKESTQSEYCDTANIDTYLGGSGGKTGHMKVEDSLVNGFITTDADAKFIVHGKVDVTGGIYSQGGDFKIQNNGKLIHVNNGIQEDTINTSTPIFVVPNKTAPQFILDVGRVTRLIGTGGIILENGYNKRADTIYTKEYNYTAVVNNAITSANDYIGQFAALANSVLTIESGAGIINNDIERDNVFFSRRDIGDGPSKVIYHNNVDIMPTICTNPYGILELASDHTPSTILGDIYIGGEDNAALNFLRPTSISTGSYKIVMNSGASNITFGSTTVEIVGTVGRETCGLGDATSSNVNYTFNNIYTTMSFVDAGTNLSNFALTVTPNEFPTNCLVMPINADFRGKRKVLATFNTTSGNPSIQSLTVGYIGSNDYEISDNLFDRTMMFGEGYVTTAQPYSWGAITTKPATNTNTLSEYGLTGVNIPLLMNGSNPPAVATLTNGNEIILFRTNVFTTVRHGRWSDPGVWSTGIPPSPTDSVIIRHIVYTGLWDGPGNQNGIGTSANDLFGARPYGKAESGINFSSSLNEALLAGKVKIVNPANWAPEGESTFTGPSALLICNYLSSTSTGAGYNFFTECEPMNFDVPLVFSEYVDELGGSTSLVIQAGGISTVLNMNFDAFIEMARSDLSTGYNNLSGLYIITDPEKPDSAPIIRALNIENNGLIQNEGIIDIGK